MVMPVPQFPIPTPRREAFRADPALMDEIAYARLYQRRVALLPIMSPTSTAAQMASRASCAASTSKHRSRDPELKAAAP